MTTLALAPLLLRYVARLQMPPRIEQLEHVLAVADAGRLGAGHAQLEDRHGGRLPGLGVGLAPAPAHERVGHRLLERRPLVVADARGSRQAPADDLGRRLQAAERWMPDL